MNNKSGGVISILTYSIVMEEVIKNYSKKEASKGVFGNKKDFCRNTAHLYINLIMFAFKALLTRISQTPVYLLYLVNCTKISFNLNCYRDLLFVGKKKSVLRL